MNEVVKGLKNKYPLNHGWVYTHDEISELLHRVYADNIDEEEYILVSLEPYDAYLYLDTDKFGKGSSIDVKVPYMDFGQFIGKNGSGIKELKRELSLLSKLKNGKEYNPVFNLYPRFDCSYSVYDKGSKIYTIGMVCDNKQDAVEREKCIRNDYEPPIFTHYLPVNKKWVLYCYFNSKPLASEFAYFNGLDSTDIDLYQEVNGMLNY